MRRQKTNSGGATGGKFCVCLGELGLFFRRLGSGGGGGGGDFLAVFTQATVGEALRCCGGKIVGKKVVHASRLALV